MGCLVMFLMASCTKEPFEGERPDARLGRLLDEYSTLLQSADNGWIGYLFPSAGGGYTFKFTFDDQNRVKMYAALGDDYASVAQESSYRLSAYQVITLLFDSYNYLHLLSDPDPSVFGGVIAFGYESDFEFSIIDVSQDTIRLLGNNFGSELLLIRATSSQGDDYIKRAYDYVQEIDKVNQFSYYHNKIDLSGRDYGITVNTIKSTVSFYYDSLGTFRNYTTEYAIADNGLILRKPFVDRELIVNSINDFSFSEGAANVTINGLSTAQIVNQEEPFIIDTDAPRRMYIESYVYTSRDGFNYNGIIDVFEIKTLPGYNGIHYAPRFYVDNYDRLYVVHNQTVQYGFVFRTAFNNEGVIRFDNYLGFNGTPPGGTNTSRFQNTASIWADPDGFYAYQTGSNCYDLVSVEDSRIWIRFN